jgi:predicted TIM-barrel fold metal-dependent hydrolase
MNANERHYSIDDFYTVRKIDAHVHLNTVNPYFLQQAQQDDFALISINVTIPWFAGIEEQQKIIVKQKESFPGHVFHLTTFQTEGVTDRGWLDRQLSYLEESFKKGALGIKVWKDIGMVIKDDNGKFIMLDDPIFDPIFNFLEENNIPVLGHIGEPKNCWLPLEEMTVNNDRDYFKGHPEYHMYLHPECPSYERLIQSVEMLLEKHPRLHYVGAHFASLEWSFDELSQRLDRFPNMAVDIAERMGQMQHQSIENWQKVYDFFVKYQDRILYGTDLIAENSDSAEQIKRKVHELWIRDWKYFNTNDVLESPFVNDKFKGLQLPKEVIDKFYCHNAKKWYSIPEVRLR